jgi:hypothetical protein
LGVDYSKGFYSKVRRKQDRECERLLLQNDPSVDDLKDALNKILREDVLSLVEFSVPGLNVPLRQDNILSRK